MTYDESFEAGIISTNFQENWKLHRGDCYPYVQEGWRLKAIWMVCGQAPVRILDIKGWGELPLLAVLCVYCYTSWPWGGNTVHDFSGRGQPEAQHLHPPKTSPCESLFLANFHLCTFPIINPGWCWEPPAGVRSESGLGRMFPIYNWLKALPVTMVWVSWCYFPWRSFPCA